MGTGTIEERAEAVVAEFSELEDWVARYRHLVQLGDAMVASDPDLRVESHAIPGCEYDVWIRADYDPAAHRLLLQADSDAKITRGIAALIVRVLDGQSPEAVESAELEFLTTIGLRSHLSARRSTGLDAMVHWIKRRARECRNGADGSRGGEAGGDG
ncbi:MAG: SufE family protein [Longimicrobiales bacterium]|nr:SufE family protein [Longimicrobiales bacterium]